VTTRRRSGDEARASKTGLYGGCARIRAAHGLRRAPAFPPRLWRLYKPRKRTTLTDHAPVSAAAGLCYRPFRALHAEVSVRPLSGWKRLWIVCSVICWVWVGHFAVANYLSAPRPISVEAWCTGDPRVWRHYNDCFAKMNTPEGRAKLARFNADVTRRYWFLLSATTVTLAGIPIVAGLLLWWSFLVVRWVWRGFQPATKSDAA